MRCLQEFHQLLKQAFQALFYENEDLPKFFLDGSISDDLANLKNAFEEGLIKLSFTSVSEFESFVDTLVLTIHESIVKLARKRD